MHNEKFIKFKNGNLRLHIQEVTPQNVAKFYQENLVTDNIYLNQIKGYYYLVDNQTHHVYDLAEATTKGLNIYGYLATKFVNNRLDLQPMPLAKSKKIIYMLSCGC